MKDIEKIKSEDLACQVADANPANFAIEQEVAQLVGATVPAPTEPSADDARELGAQLLVFLRRALLPIQSALRTAVAAIYAHLDSRCTAYTPAAYASYIPRPYDPMGTPPTPRSVANILTALTAFASRKIGGAIGAPDGVPLVRLACNSATAATVTELTDNTDWGEETYANIASFVNLFPNLKKFKANCNGTMTNRMFYNRDNLEEITMPKITYIHNLEYTAGKCIESCHSLKKIDMESVNQIFAEGSNGGPCIYDCPNVAFLRIGKIDSRFRRLIGSDSSSKLLHFEIGAGTNISLDISGWDPTYVLSTNPTGTDLIEEGSTAENNLQQFLVNFKNYIALRLTANGSGKTLTLSQAVFSAVIEGSSPICDDIKGIIVEKGWQVKDTNNIIFPT